jgi:uncharacterized cupin superfamily protein
METRLKNLADLPRLYDGAEAQLGKAVGVKQFGVNHIILAPGSFSSRRHWHEEEDELVVVLEGEATLIDNNGGHTLKPGDVVGFPRGEPNAHHITNRTDAPAVILVVGTRHVGVEHCHYPDDGGVRVPLERDAGGERVKR